MIIDANELVLDEDVRIYEGKPFSGIAKSYYPDRSIKAETRFHDGFEEGLCREWHCNGQLSRQWHASRGLVDGKRIAWHESGRVKSIGCYSRGIHLCLYEWDDDGLLVRQETIDVAGALFKHLYRSTAEASS